MIPVTLSLRFRSRLDGEQDESTMQVSGTLEQEIGGFALRYTERMDDADTQVLIRTDGHRAVISRSGPASVTFTLEPNIPHDCEYVTDAGTIPMTVKDAFVESNVSETGGILHLRYTLELGGGDSFHEISIVVRKG